MEILSIRTKADYLRTLKEIETLMDAAPKSQKGERLDVLVTLVEVYERKHFPCNKLCHGAKLTTINRRTTSE